MNNTIERENTDKEIQQVLNELFNKTPDIRPLMKNIVNSNSNLVERNEK